MKLSEDGYKKVKGYEGYYTKLPDGSCTAYQIKYRGKMDKVTIGWGCTKDENGHDLKLGTVWTKEQAEAGLRREMEEFERAVTRLVTVDLNQNEFDSLCLLTYNIGSGALAKSTCLKRLNRDDRKGAASAMQLFNKVGKYVEPGLVSRRASEAALFLKPVAQPDEPSMPQSVDASRAPLPGPVVATGACTATAGALQFIPAPPLDMVSNVAGWQSSAETLTAFSGSPVLKYAIAGMLIYALGGHVWPWLARKFA